MSSAQVTITQLPTAGPITGTESVPIVQNGQTVQTTTGAIAASPSQTQTFLTVNQEPTLPNSRALSATTGIGLTDGGAQSTLTISLNGASGSLEAAGNGFAVKTGSTTITPRTFTVSGVGLGLTNGDGQSGNPVFALTGLVESLANASGTGMLAMVSGSTVTPRSITGTSDQISVANGDGSGNPTIAIASNPALPGAAGVVVPTGGTSSRAGSPSNGTLRYNTDTGVFEGYANNAWGSIASGAGVTSITAGTGLNGGTITSTGTISIADTAVTAGSYGSGTKVGTFTVNAQAGLTAAADVDITASGIGAVASVSGTANEITASGTTNVTLSLPSALTFTGKTVTGGTFNMTAATVGSDTVTTNTATQTLTGKTISGGSNTLTNIANSSLTNSSVTIGTTAVSLGATALTLGGLTSVTVTQDPTSDYQLATKQYVDNVAQGLNVKASCLWGTTANITLSGLSTQAGGEWTGSLTAGDRILVKNQSTAADNGIYVADASTWSRSADANTWAELVSAFTFVQSGATLTNTGWVCTVSPGGTLGVTAVTWSQFSGAGTYTAGTGLTLAGNQFSITNTAVSASSYGSASQVGTFTVNAQGQLTAAASTSIAIAASQVTSGTLAVAQGGTNLASYTAGDLLYASGTTALSKLTLGTSSYVLVAGASAPEYVAQSTLSVGSATTATTATTATNATNTGITSNSTNATNYLTFVSATTGNLPQLVNSSITCNPSTGKITAGVSGGTF